MDNGKGSTDAEVGVGEEDPAVARETLELYLAQSPTLLSLVRQSKESGSQPELTESQLKEELENLLHFRQPAPA